MSHESSTLPDTMHKTLLTIQGLNGWGVCTNTPRCTQAQYIQGINRQTGFLCLSTTQQMFLQIQSTIIFNKELNRGTATAKVGLCFPVTFSKAQRKLYFSHNLPKPAQYPYKAFDKCAINVSEGGSWTYQTPWPTFLGRSNEGQTHEKHYFGSTYICKAKYFREFYSSLLDQTFPNYMKKENTKNFKPQTWLWNHGSVNKHSSDDFTYP